MTTSTHAAEWALGGTDYYVADAGAECYSDFTDYVVHSCECDWNVPDYYWCPGDDGCGTLTDADGSTQQVCYQLECRLGGEPATGYTKFCWDKNGPDACVSCGCEDTDSGWVSTGSGNRVKRTYVSHQTVDYTCTPETTTVYGCAAGYYKSAGSGSSMTCTACPSGGTSVAGNSSGIGACCMAAGSSFTDTKGTYTCSGQACYQS